MKISITYTPKFVRQYKKLPQNLKDEIKLKIRLFEDINNHKILKVHKLNGQLKGFLSFSLDYSHRIIFEYVSKNEVAIVKVGDHSVYEKYE